jgi:hypothetical protein
MCRYLGAEVAGMLYGTATEPGEIAKNKGLMKEAHELGKQLAGQG